MINKTSKILFLLITVNCNLYAQKEAINWQFGDSIGLKFDATPPSFVNKGNTNNPYACSSISDAKGNLIMYTDGKKVWNGRHQLVNNGELFNDSIQNSGDGTIILKLEGALNKYCLITSISTSGYHNGSKKQLLISGLYYSIIEFNGQDSLGVVTTKNIRFYKGNTGAIAVKKNKNGGFVLASVEMDSSAVVLFEFNGKVWRKITSSRLTFKPFVLLNVQLKFSPSGEYIAFANTTNILTDNKLYIIRYDSYTEQVLQIKIVNNISPIFIEFSPNSRFLYLSAAGWSVQWNNTIGGSYQLEIEKVKDLDTLNDLNAYKISDTTFRSYQLTPDNKICIAFTKNWDANDTLAWVSCIQYPDKKGKSCNFIKYYKVLPYTKEKNVLMCLPNFCVDYLTAPWLSADSVCPGQSTLVKVNRFAADSVSWYVEGMPIVTATTDTFRHQFTFGGSHLMAVLHYYRSTDTLYHTVWVHHAPKPNLGPDTLICHGQTITMQSQYPYDSVQWNNGSNKPVVSTSTQGVYILTGYTGACSNADTLQLYTANCTLNATDTCAGKTAVITAIETTFDSIIWQPIPSVSISSSQRQLLYNYTKAGQYQIKATGYKNAMRLPMQTTLTIEELPQKVLPDSMFWCEPQELVPQSVAASHTCLWENGSQNCNRYINQSGTYSLQLNSRYCQSTYPTRINITPCRCLVYIPEVFSPNADELNNSFGLVSECQIRAIELEIYNRWGELLVRQTTNNKQEARWDGSYLGQPCRQGSYLYKLSYTEPNGEKQFRRGLIYLVQ